MPFTTATETTAGYWSVRRFVLFEMLMCFLGMLLTVLYQTGNVGRDALWGTVAVNSLGVLVPLLTFWI